MNTNLLAIALSVLVTAVLAIATSSIATECYDKNPELKTEKKDNYNYIIVTLVMNILMILVAFYSLYLSFKTD
jgi:hypothetical protein